MNDLLILKNLNLFIFAKDKSFKYLYCNEIFAEVAGLDSPSQIRNKTDHDLFWHKQANLYNAGDRLVLSGGALVNTLEPQLQPKKAASILTTKTLLKSQSGKLLGLVGSYIDVSDYTIKKNNGYFDHNKRKFYLGDSPNSQYLTIHELYVFKAILLGWDIDRIAKKIHRSKKAVESHVAKIKNKLQCEHKNEIVPRAIELGLTHLLGCTEINME